MSKVAVLGAGSWGTALSLELARSGLDVNLWGHLPEHIEQLRTDRENTEFLPGFVFPDNLTPEADLAKCLNGASEVLVVVPSHAFASIITTIKPFLKADASLCWATKGLDQGILHHS